MTSIAGTGTSSYSGDGGQATAAALQPKGIAVDSSGIIILFSISFTNIFSLGNVYIADTSNKRIRKVTVSTGIITTIAGTGTNSYSGDNGPATSATLFYPSGVALDSAGTQRYF